MNSRYHIILASGSPRRRELLSGLDIPFEVRVIAGLEESYPPATPTDEIPLYLARQKAEAYDIAPDELLITADTVVILDDRVMGKPADEAGARAMLRALSGRTHRVITGVALTTQERQRSFSVTTRVTFKELTPEEIAYYVTHYHPLDKAGAYGIQEWIGHIGVKALEGSFFNVMGLPVQRIYEELALM